MAEFGTAALIGAAVAYGIEKSLACIDAYGHLREKCPGLLSSHEEAIAVIQRIEQDIPNMDECQMLALVNMKSAVEKYHRIIQICSQRRIWSVARAVIFSERYLESLEDCYKRLMIGMTSLAMRETLYTANENRRADTRLPSLGSPPLVPASRPFDRYNWPMDSIVTPDSPTPSMITISSSSSSSSSSSTLGTVSGSWPSLPSLERSASHRRVFPQGESLSASVAYDQLPLLIWGGKGRSIDTKLAEMWLEDISEGLDDKEDAIIQGYQAIILDPNVHGANEVVKHKELSNACWARAFSIGIEDLATEDHCPHAQFLLGWWTYHNSSHDSVNEGSYSKAYILFTWAATKNHPKAIHMAGHMCEHGHGVPSKCTFQALRFYDRAATMGNACANYRRALAHLEAEDLNEAFRKAKLAADYGSADAQWLVAKMYSKGNGTAINFEEYRKYLILASDQGHPEAERARMYPLAEC